MTNITLIGRLTKDVEIVKSRNGNVFGTVSIACDTDKDETSFFNLALTEKQAETLSKWSGKGKRLLVIGSIKQKDKYYNVYVEKFSIIDFNEKDEKGRY